MPPSAHITVAALAAELRLPVRDVSALVSALCRSDGPRAVVHTPATSNGRTVLLGTAADTIRDTVHTRTAAQASAPAAGGGTDDEEDVFLQGPPTVGSESAPAPVPALVPVELTPEQLDRLIGVGNKAIGAQYHEDLCGCASWPTSCASRYGRRTWDTAAWAIGLPDVLAAWEQLRASA